MIVLQALGLTLLIMAGMVVAGFLLMTWADFMYKLSNGAEWGYLVALGVPFGILVFIASLLMLMGV